MSEKMSIEEYKEKMEELFDECEKVLAQFKGDTLAELKESKKEKWKPEIEEIYWVRNSGGESMSVCWLGTSTDYWRYNNIPIFPTKTECEKYCRFMDTVKEKSYEFSKEEWENVDIPKFIVKRNYEKDYFEVGCFQSIKYFNTTYFKTEEDAQYIIDNFKDELMEYWI